TVDSPKQRAVIAAYDFSHPDFFIGVKDTPWNRRTASKVTVGEPKVHEGRASIEVRIEAPGVNGATVTYSLDTGMKSLNVDWVIDKIHNRDAEAVLFAFPLK